MAVQCSGAYLPNSVTNNGFLQHRPLPLYGRRRASSAAFASTHFHSSPTIQIVGGSPSLYRDGNDSNVLDNTSVEDNWFDLESDLNHWIKTLPKTERELKEQLKLMDVVVEVRDARIPMSTSHPQMDLWIGNRKRILVLNREDMISTSDRNAWAAYFAKQGIRGSMKLSRLAKSLAVDVNVKRKSQGPASSWVRFGKDLELLDSPGIIPMRISDQSAAIKLAICDDIGERSYDVTDIAAILVQMLAKIPSIGTKTLYSRYKIQTDGQSGQTFVHKLALKLFSGDVHQAAFRILTDFRKGKFGWFALERPPR
ncbi:DAR GTPase 3 chloroplastic [Bienertia sinuspersici]